jgi:two-component system chemotaxis response regulator CheY
MATILIVDDSPVSRRLLSFTLERIGHTIVTANDGHEALSQLTQQPVDLIIADLVMPEMDGLTLLRHVRAGAASRTTPLIMLTASGQDQDRLEASQAGASSFLTKPTSSRELISTVDQLLG